MTDLRISQLPADDVIDGTETLPLVQASGNRRATLAAIRDFVRAGFTLAWDSITNRPNTLSGYGITDAVAANDPRLSNARTPTGAAGGVLSGSYPNPGFAIDLATQAELDAHIASEASIAASGHLAAADKTKLDGIQNGATANATDAQLRDRGTHTGTQPIASVSGLQAALDGKLTTPTAQILADAASITWNVANGPVATVTLGGNRTLALPTGIALGGTYILRVRQDATGGRTLAYAAGITWLAGAPSLASGANKTTILTLVCFEAGSLLGAGAVVEP